MKQALFHHMCLHLKLTQKGPDAPNIEWTMNRLRIFFDFHPIRIAEFRREISKGTSAGLKHYFGIIIESIYLSAA